MRSVCAAILLLFLAFPVRAFTGEDVAPPEATASAEAEKERRELWTGRLYTSTYRAGICINDRGALRGAVYLRQLGGAVDRYTVSGTVEDGRVTARHGSGHVFQGYFVSESEVEGELTLKNGRKLRVLAARGQNAEVDEDCRLLRP